MRKILVSAFLALAMVSGFAIVAHADEPGPAPTKKVHRVRHHKKAVMQQAPMPAPVMAVAPAPAPMIPTMCPGQQYILAEAWTTTPVRSAKAGFTGLPLRNCEGTYCGKLAELPRGAQVDVLLEAREGWALVHVPSTDMCGWVSTQSIFQNVCGLGM